MLKNETSTATTANTAVDSFRGILPFKHHLLYKKSHTSSVSPSTAAASMVIFKKHEISPHIHNYEDFDETVSLCCRCWCCFFTSHTTTFKKRLSYVKNHIRNMQTLTAEEIEFISSLDKKHLIEIFLLYNECQEIVTDYLVGI